MDNRIVAPNLAELYRLAAERYDQLPAFATRHSGEQWEPVSFRDLYEKGRDLATGLIELGVNARDHIGLFSDNRFEWILADYGIQLCGAVNVPRGTDVTDDELVYIINHAQIQVALIETAEMQKRVLRIKSKLTGLRELILLDPDVDAQPGVRQLSDICDIGSGLRSDGDTRTDDRMTDVQPDDLFTLIYTSGTTGHPKGVMLTHSNMMSQMKVIPITLTCTDRVLSILPIWHIFERVFEVYTISCGTCTYYSNVRTLADDLQQVEPTFMGSAPRLWESLYQKIMRRVRESHPVRRALFHIAYFLGHYYKESLYFLFGNDLRVRKQPISQRILLYPVHGLRWLFLLPWYGFFNVAVLEPVRQSTGGSLKATVSGGGALPIEIDRFFNYVGIPVLEGYGMTETSPVLAVRTDKELVVGTVGPVVSDTEIRIVDPETETVFYPDQQHIDGGRGLRGEIWVRGPQVMKGYYRDSELTDRTIRDGWLRTGDLGMITFNNCLKILGRCKSTIVLLSGENLEPEPIEMQLRQSRYIEQCIIVGQDQKHICALILPSLAGFQESGVRATTLSELAENPEVRNILQTEIRSMISISNGYKRFEQIHDFRIIRQNFEVGEELTTLFKLKRHIIYDKYADLIRDIYEPNTAKTS